MEFHAQNFGLRTNGRRDKRSDGLTIRSREAAEEYSPRRKPWVGAEKYKSAPKGRKKNAVQLRGLPMMLFAELALFQQHRRAQEDSNQPKHRQRQKCN